MIRLNNIKIRENLSDIDVFKRAIEKNKIKQEEVEEWYIYKKSIDARKKDDIFLNYAIDIQLKDTKRENKFTQVKEEKWPQIKVKRNIWKEKTN